MGTTEPTPRLLILATALGLLLAAPALQTQAAPGGARGDPAVVVANDDYRFVFVADSRGDGRTTGSDWGVNEAALDAVFDSIADLNPEPSFIFFGGDLVYGKRNLDSMRQQFDEWRQVVARHYPPSQIFPVFGGHERTSGSTAAAAWRGFEDYFDPKSQETPGGEPVMDCSYYDKNHNPPRDNTDFSHTVYYCDYAQDRFFVLNNDCIPPRHSVIGDAPDGFGCVRHELGCGQLNWIKEHLVGNGKRHNFFFQHEPTFGTGAHETWDRNAQQYIYDKTNCPDPLGQGLGVKKAPRNDYIRLLGFNNGTAIFAGHEHQYTWRSINYQFTHKRLNNPAPEGARKRVKRSLALLIEAAPEGAAGRYAVAYSHEGAVASGRRSRAPILRLWWNGTGGQPDWQGRVDRGSDDAEEFYRNGGQVDLDDPALELMRKGPRPRHRHRFVALRWTNVKIPKSKPVSRAEVVFTAKEDSASGPTVRITGEATPFAFPFSQCRQDIGLRRQSAATVDWEIGRWQRNQTYRTPDLAPILRELVEEHGVGTRFRSKILEIKTGSCGAPWMGGSCKAFMGRVQAELIRLADYGGDGMPYHYAVVDVRGDDFEVTVRSWDGTLLPVP